MSRPSFKQIEFDEESIDRILNQMRCAATQCSYEVKQPHLTARECAMLLKYIDEKLNGM